MSLQEIVMVCVFVCMYVCVCYNNFENWNKIAFPDIKNWPGINNSN